LKQIVCVLFVYLLFHSAIISSNNMTYEGRRLVFSELEKRLKTPVLI